MAGKNKPSAGSGRCDPSMSEIKEGRSISVEQREKTYRESDLNRFPSHSHRKMAGEEAKGD